MDALALNFKTENRKGKTMTKVTLDDENYLLVKSSYCTNNAIAISAYEEDGELFMDLTTNTEDARIHLEKGEIMVKTWSENEPYIKPLLESGYFEDTKRRVSLGRVEAQIWKILKVIDDDDFVDQGGAE